MARRMTPGVLTSPVRPQPYTATVPWYVWIAVAGVISSVIGVGWDISWHKSIGRDSFWTVPHLFIYAGGILIGCAAGCLILYTTFQRSAPLREASVRMWGFRAPLGAFVCAWGGVTMLSSAPFDNWWHNAYGLDTKILSPPHMVLALGILATRYGTLLLILSCINRAAGSAARALRALYFFVGGVIFTTAIGSFLELTTRNYMHSARFYRIVCGVSLIVVVAIARAARVRLACTALMGVYTAVYLVFLWILPLFPAEPKLGPVYYKVTHFIPPDFPLLLIVPAVLLDLLWPKIASWDRWLQALAAASAFLASFAAVQWPFANFLMSPGARNWFFGTHYLPFFMPPQTDYARYVFTAVERTAGGFWLGMLGAVIAGTISARIGMAWGDWMKDIRR